jgi:bifunctional non-homologous end joining protein LigD
LRKQSAGGKKREDRGSLDEYRRKRDPAVTPEPFAAERIHSAGPTLHGDFVVHLHAASRSHYDLRLQIGDTLKSFAVPRGPSLDPEEKRLAVHTEDHPLEYLDFEDVIPEGNYGAGPMIVWDRGRVVYLDGSAEDGLDKAKLDFRLTGYKLRGRFALIHTGARAPTGSAEAQHWLLIKKRDAFASSERDVLGEQPHSVLSGLRVDQLANAAAIGAALEARAAKLGANKRDVDVSKLEPMLCALDGAELDQQGWLYELKLDGYRIVADRRGEQVDLRYRRKGVATASYPEVARAVRALAPRRVVLDGEIVAFDDDGKPSFQRLGRRLHARRPFEVRRAAAEVPVVYLAFDLLALGDHDLRALPLHERKRLLLELLPGRGLLRALDHLEDDGRPLYELCQQQGLEGVVAKRADSVYRPGPKRTGDWVKIKCLRDEEFVVVGWEQRSNARTLGSLIVASYLGDTLVSRGKVGSGLDDATIDELHRRLEPLAISDAPLATRLRNAKKRHWVEPKLVVSVEFLGFTDGGGLRHPVFRGIRDEVPAHACTAAPIDERLAHAQQAGGDETELGPRLPARDVAVRTKLSNQDKVFWPAAGYTKGDLCDYYASIAEVLLPHLKNRPIVLVRYPDGIDGKSFYQWNVPEGTPSWLRTLELRAEGERGKRRRATFLVDDIDGLLHVANLGCIPIHMLAAREGQLERCDFLTIDFDIGEQPFKHAITLALALRQMLDDIGLPSFPKTSGQSGLHVLIPMGPGASFPVAKTLVELLGRLLVLQHPSIATMERRVDQRGPKVYVDTGQTGRARTIVAPYSVRAVAGATVSTPLTWSEVHLALDPSRFSMFRVPERVATHGDPLAGLLDAQPDVAAAVAALQRKFGA